MIIVSDLEGTLTTGATWRGFGEYLKKHRRGFVYRLFVLTRLPLIALARAGILDPQTVRSGWLTGQIRIFRGATRSQVVQMADWVVEYEMWPRRRLDVLAELEAHRQAGATLIIATGTYQPIAKAFARRIGAKAIGTPLAFSHERLAGLDAPIGVKDHKVSAVRAFLKGAAVDVAYGDTLSDLPLLEIAREPVAVYPDRKLLRAATERGWRVIGQPAG